MKRRWEAFMIGHSKVGFITDSGRFRQSFCKSGSVPASISAPLS